MAKKEMPQAVVQEVERLLTIITKQSKRDLKNREPWHKPESIFSTVGEEEQEIEVVVRRAKKALARYIFEPTPARATKVAKLIILANGLRMFSKMLAENLSDREPGSTIPSEYLPFQIPGVF